MASLKGLDNPFRLVSTGNSPSVIEGDAVFDRSIREIILTYPGERPYRPNFGCYAARKLFSNMTELTAIQVGSEIRRALTQWEPRITVRDILFALDGSTITLEITWRVNGTRRDSTTTIDSVV